MEPLFNPQVEGISVKVGLIWVGLTIAAEEVLVQPE